MRASRHGFSLAETLVALLLVSLAAMLQVRVSAANATALAQTIKQASAIRLASEFSAWTHRGGHRALGLSLDQAIEESTVHLTSCYEDCSARQSAWHFLSHWRERLAIEIPDARVSICVDQSAALMPASWPCDPRGDAWVMKLAWPPASESAPAIAVELGPA